LVEFSTRRHTVVIVGGGFSGAVLAINLLRRPPSKATDLILIERNAGIGRGVAYAQRDFPYLLNVAAGRLSIESNDPEDFLRFASRYDSAAKAGDFLPRAWYGDYLEDALRRAESAAPAHIRLQRVHGEVRAIEAEGSTRLRVMSAEHPPILADRVVLALGNPPPPLLPWAEEVQEHRGYLHDPWQVPQDLEPHHAVLVIGNGLTMADVVLALTHERKQGPMVHTLSRRGLVPLSQSQERVDPSAEEMRGDGAQLLAASHSLRQLLRTIRRLVRESQAGGGDWRPVIQLVRHWAQQLWHALPHPEQRRFVRHLLPIWSVHRHRQPPQSAQRLEQLREQGRLQVKAGRIQKMAERDGRIKVWWEPRGAADCESLHVDLVINALGPDYVLERTTDPLTLSLLKSGMIVADPLQLGLRTGAHGACIDREGRTSQRLFYLGPMLRAGHWEITGAAELLQWADDLAEHLRTSAEVSA
jgi:uncharacterized NAD(P)/FAD-binding protein YdhS